MQSEPHKKLPNKKIIKTAKFEAKEQFTKSSLENLNTENKRLIKNLIDSGEFKTNNWENFYIRDFKFVRVKERLGSGVGTYKYSVNN